MNNFTNKEILFQEMKEECFQRRKSIMELDKDFFPQPWLPSQWESTFGDSNSKIFLALSESQDVVGFSLFNLLPNDGQCHLLKIVMVPTYRSFGNALKLASLSLSHLKTEGSTNCYLEVSTNNAAGLRLYAKLGFKSLVCKKKYYSNGDDAYAMQLFFE